MSGLLSLIEKHWGYTQLRPLQHEAMEAAQARRDSLVVLPTGGGKSLCYQAPALLSDGVTVVVSPLISLMKDQVDALLSRDIPAAFLNSSLEADDRRRVTAELARGAYKLIFVAPERFAGDHFYRLIEGARVASFAIDEAHCISHWGHDFREDYRKLGELKRRFPEVPVHAFTATATPRVREDVIAQLGMKDPAILVGDFFRPNLVYRVERRNDAFEDVHREIEQRPGQAGIVYCIRRADVDALARRLAAERVRVAPYHAGMTDEARTRVQDRFSSGAVDVIVATVAFGMGIDRSDIRFVIHAAMPKSLEHYQQETGRAGRDGRPADCILFYSGGDFGLWKSIIEKNETADSDPKMRMLSEMYGYCREGRCRHRRLVEYFGQVWGREGCAACDVCRGERAARPDSAAVSRTLLSGIAGTGQRFGAMYVAEVLSGEGTERVLQRGHNDAKEFGALSGHPKPEIMAWMDQLVEQGLLSREPEYGVLSLTAAGWRVARGLEEAKICDVEASRPRTRRRKEAPRESAANAGWRGGRRRLPEKTDEAPAAGAVALDGTSLALFERLRSLRRSIANERGVPAFMILSDKTLRHMARAVPTSPSEMRAIHGIGPAKWEAFGEQFLAAIRGQEA